MCIRDRGIDEYEWYQKNGVYDSGGGLKLRCRDIAKYGLLHLNKGKWNQAEIVSAEWIEQVLTPYIEIKDPFYGCYQWQMAKTNLGFNVWFIPGNGGQIINLIPALKMVIVVNADNRNISNNNRLPLQHLMQQIFRIHPDLQ
jgi:CubicO group peptidase (beta-lactamase class C family)